MVPWRLGIGLALAAGALAASPLVLEGQACHGRPTATGIAYEYGNFLLGNSHGVSGAIVGGRTTLDANVRVSDKDELSVTEQVATVRFSMQFGAKGQGLSVCPGIGLGYLHQKVDFEGSTSVDAMIAGGRGTIGVGYETPSWQGLSVIPFVVGLLQYTATLYDLKDPASDVDKGGDFRASGELEYGAVGRYKVLYLGLANQYALGERGGLYLTRLIVGVSFPGGGREGTRSSNTR